MDVHTPISRPDFAMIEHGVERMTVTKGYYEDCFVVDGERYMLTITESGNVDFALLGHEHRSEDGLFWDDDEIFRDTNVGVKPIKVFKAIADRVVGWMNANKKSMVGFHALTGRRAMLYDWLCQRHLQAYPRFYYYTFGATFYFFRKKTQSNGYRSWGW